MHKRAQSFAGPAAVLYSLSSMRAFNLQTAARYAARPSPTLSGFFRTGGLDDEMRGSLMGAIESLSSLARENLEVPLSIPRAADDVERIAQIEESALPHTRQDAIRFTLPQIARLAGENGRGGGEPGDGHSQYNYRIRKRGWHGRNWNRSQSR